MTWVSLPCTRLIGIGPFDYIIQIELFYTDEQAKHF